MSAHSLHRAVLVLGVALASARAWGYPVEIYRGYEPGDGVFACCGAIALGVLVLVFVAHLISRSASVGSVFGLLAAMLVAAWATFRDGKSFVDHVVTADSAQQLRIEAISRDRRIERSTRRVPTAEVRCFVERYESCDREGENCQDRFRVVLLHRGSPLIPYTETVDYLQERTARERCARMATLGVQPASNR